MDFTDGTVLVTGAGSGIGRATARRAAEEGAFALVADVDADAGRLAETSPGERDRLIDVNLKGAWNGCRAALPHLDAGDAIVNVASISGVLGTPYFATYAATKAGVLALTKSLAWEVGADGVRVNAVCPGTVDTPMARGGFREREDPAAVRREEERHHALGRLADPDEVAAAIAFLASDEASFVTGHGLVVDGGYSAVTRPYG